MYPASFEYFKPSTVDEALDLLDRHADDAKLLAGGQSLIPIMKLGLGSPEVLIDLNGITELEYVERRGGLLLVGALARHSALGAGSPAGGDLAMVTDAVPSIADPQVRSRGTVVGALVEADPAGDWAPILLALGGEITCVSSQGARVVSSEDFFEDLYTTAVGPHEIVTEVRIRLPRSGSTGAYLKLERKTGDFAVVGVAVQLDLDADGTCRDVGIGLCGVATTPLKAVAAEAVLRGSDLSDESVAAAIEQLDDIMNPWSDTKGPADYKRRMAAVFLRRTIQRARDRFATV